MLRYVYTAIHGTDSGLAVSVSPVMAKVAIASVVPG